MRKIGLVVVMSLVAASCVGGHTVQYTHTTTEVCCGGYSPLHYLDASSSLVPSINPNAPEACTYVPSDVSGRRDYCRLVWGDFYTGDYHNWVIQFLADGRPGGGPSILVDDPGYGYAMTTDTGESYEGCDINFSTDTYICDYKVTNQFVAVVGGCGECFLYVLDKLWEWSHYELSADVSCVKGVYDAVTKGFRITNTFLIDCTDEPYHGQ